MIPIYFWRESGRLKIEKEIVGKYVGAEVVYSSTAENVRVEVNEKNDEFLDPTKNDDSSLIQFTQSVIGQLFCR